ncbi:MAG: CAP domain-containing protein [Puniceicoccaceae bacterium]
MIADISGPDYQQLETFIQLLNEHREANSQAPVSGDENLITSAQWMAEDILVSGNFSRIDSLERDSAERIQAFGYNHTSIELLAFGYNVVSDVLDAWIESTEHNAVLLSPEIATIGLGKAGTYWVLDLGYTLQDTIDFVSIPDPTGLAELEQLVNLLNEHRESNNVDPVGGDSILLESARWMADDILSSGNFSRTDSLGRDSNERIQAFGYNFLNIELLAFGFSSVDSVFQAWVSSAPQNEVLLNPDIKAVGLGLCGEYWVLDLGYELQEAINFNTSTMFGPYEVRPDGYCDTTPWLGWIWAENDPWIWSVSLGKWIFCPGENVSTSGAWVYLGT